MNTGMKILLIIALCNILFNNLSYPQYHYSNKNSTGISQNFENYIVYGDTIHVPVEQPTIQAGIDTAKTGDLVLVAEGTYSENIIFKGINVTLASYFILDGDESHIQNTIIDGSHPLNQYEGSVVTFRNFEDTTTVVCGFTITGGIGGYQGFIAGGGILIYLAAPKIENNIIENNIIDSPIGEAGAGICAYIQSGYPLIIRNNIIRNNILKNTSTHTYGGGIAIWPDDYTPYLVRVNIENNVIENNQSLGNTFSFGGGILVYGGGSVWWATIRNNKIVGNSVSLTSTQSYGGGLALNYTNANISNNLIVYNKAYESAGIKNIDEGAWNTFYANNTICFNEAINDAGGISTSYIGQILNSIVWNNQPNQFTAGLQVLDISYSLIGESYPGIGNINGNPSFIDTVYFLLDENLSPCVDAGNPDPIYYDIEDPENPGFALYPSLGTVVNDIGHFGGPNANWIITGVHDDSYNPALLKNYLLSQNYPNFFNPTTIIKYEIPELSFVTIKIYDVLGNEIATLVNEEKKVGSYEVEFSSIGGSASGRNAYSLPSGVYFFKLEAGKFSETKKMILLK
jgi:hypothetical protein